MQFLRSLTKATSKGKAHAQPLVRDIILTGESFTAAELWAEHEEVFENFPDFVQQEIRTKKCLQNQKERKKLRARACKSREEKSASSRARQWSVSSWDLTK